MPSCFFKSELRPVWFQESLRNRGSDWSGNLGSRARCLVTIQGGDVSDLLTLDLIISAGRGGDFGFVYGIMCNWRRKFWFGLWHDLYIPRRKFRFRLW
jgi:hypothetical protein